MLVKCPKCGFSQPTDQFCARCGVDMEAFKPRPESSVATLFRSPVFQIGLVIAIIGGSTAFVMNRSRLMTPDAPRSSLRNKAYTNSDIDQTVAVQTETSIVQSASAVPSSPGEASFAANENGTLMASEAENVTLTTRSEVASAVPAGGTTSSAALPNTSGGSVKIRVSYTMIENGFLNRIYEDSQASGQFATFASYNAGLLPEIEKKLNPSNTRIRILHKVEERLDEGKIKSWFLGTKNPDGEEDLGLTTSIEFKSVDSSGVFRGGFVVTRSWREKTTYPADVEIAPHNGFFISGVLPRSLPDGVLASITSISPFDVLKEASFRSKASEFVIFLELTK